jgi:inner membrane protein
MDNLTHSLTGLVLARAGLDRLTPRASLILLLAANTPDIDIITAWGGAHGYLDHHRGITHSLLALPLVAALPPLVAWRFSWGAYLASTVGVLSHLLMDWTNIYGIRLLTPVTERWFRLDIISVVDPWIWAVLILTTLWPLLALLVSGEISSGASCTSGHSPCSIPACGSAGRRRALRRFPLWPIRWPGRGSWKSAMPGFRCR